MAHRRNFIIFKDVFLLMKTKGIVFVLFLALFLTSFSCKKRDGKEDETMKIAVFLPGVRAESAIYDMLASGAERAVLDAEKNGKKVDLTVLEAGVNQGQWVEKLSNLVAEEKYDIVVSSNPSMPLIAKEVLDRFPENKFLLLDAYCEDEPKITTAQYNQAEQAYVAGYMAALVSTSDMKMANKQKKIGLIAGQEYPDMLDVILPNFIKGAKDVDEEMEVDFRIVGNWYDASRGAELASSMYDAGADVVMPICGGANQGVISSAEENGFYLLWFDSNGYKKSVGHVVGSATLEQERLAYEKISSFINGDLKEGVPEVLGMKAGYIKFITDDDSYISTVPKELREKQDEMLKKIEAGILVISAR